jgi:hypothetical protein
VAQHDYSIANGSGAAVRSDLNNALSAIVSQNSGTTEPTTTYAYMRWADTTAGVMKMRNGANNAWITLYQLDGEWSTIAFENGSASAPSIYFKDSGTDTGIYSPGTDQVAISTGGTGRLFVDSSGRVGLGTSSPGAKLQVSQNTDAGTAISVVSASASTGLTTDYATLFLQNTNTTNNNYNAIGFVNDQGGYSSAIYGIYTSHTSGSQSGALAFSTRNAGTFDERMRITAAGNVGIGTTSPLYKVQIEGSSSTVYSGSARNTLLGIYNPDTTSGVYAGIELQAAGVGNASLANISAIDAGSGSTDLAFGLRNSNTFEEKVRITSAGRLLVGTSTAQGTSIVQVCGNSTASTDPGDLRIIRGLGVSSIGANVGAALGYIRFGTFEGAVGATIEAQSDATWSSTSDTPGRLVFSTTADGASSPTERMRIDSIGRVLIGTTTSNPAFNNVVGGQFSAGLIESSNNGDICGRFNRKTNDGTLVEFYQDGTLEGTISVSGSTVSYNGAHLSRWSQLPGGIERTEILRGTVLSNIDEMCGWGEEENEQLNRMKVSDVEGDPNVAGVFQAWDDDDDTYTDDFYCAMTGDFIIRIAEGTAVQRGDLLMSAGDGTAKPQGDDIVRGKTIAKVTSTHVTCTYDDGSYCVPCVLMAC